MSPRNTCAMLFVASFYIAAAVAARPNTGSVAATDVTLTYEDITVPLLAKLGIGDGQVPSPYDGLHSDSMTIGRVSVVGTQPVQPIGKQFAIGGNGSSVSSVYAGSVKTIVAKHAYFGAYLATDQGQTPGVVGTITVTASKGGKAKGSTACHYKGFGMFDLCVFPTSWGSIDTLSYSVAGSGPLNFAAAVADPLLTFLGVTAVTGHVGFIYFGMDNLTYSVSS